MKGIEGDSEGGCRGDDFRVLRGDFWGFWVILSVD